MILRFSLYGFLKNQTYFEPFLVLAFREAGMSFFEIGLLIGFREVVINLFEVPSGALADLHGRRRCMVVSFASYIISFLILAYGAELWHLFAGMFFFGGGEAFRTGTHKAMIFDWLRAQGRADERTKVYGYTRSWSKLGSAISVLIASALVFYGGSYRSIFLFAIAPYLANLINLATYPASLDGNRSTEVSFRQMARHLWRVASDAMRTPMLRRLLCECMSCEGVYAAVKDYLQPILKLAALSLPILLSVSDRQRTAVVVGAVYFVLHLLSSAASRYSHVTVERWGGEEGAARRLWWIVLVAFLLLIVTLRLRLEGGTVALFVLLSVTQNLWRPVLIGRFDSHSKPEVAATLLSLESQANSVSTMLVAPLLGYMVDWANAGVATDSERTFWPIAVAGAAPALLMLVWRSPARELRNLPDPPRSGSESRDPA
ncbi:MAG: MFS transporter [Planctomycetota bacterium]|nr:MFS transporter [Planctomycetota bacterium]